MTFEFFPYTEKVKKEWDNFVINHPIGSIHQIAAWKTFQESIPGRDQVLGFGLRDRQTKRIAATTFCVKMETGVLGKYWFYSARGPVFDFDRMPEAGPLLINNIAQELKQTNALFWRVDPYLPVSDDQVQARLFEKVSVFPAVQNYQPTDTLEIDLSKSDEQIRAEMKRKGRYNINLAQKKGVLVRVIPGAKVAAKDIDDFWGLTSETTSRDRFSGHQKAYYRHFCKKLALYVVLFFAETASGKRIATAINTHCGKKAIYYFGASTSDPNYRNLMAPYELQWEMMQYAKQRGCTSYDFLGIAPEGAPNHPYAGISEFKWKFGGQRKTYHAGKEIVLNPWWYRIYRFVKKIKK